MKKLGIIVAKEDIFAHATLNQPFRLLTVPWQPANTNIDHREIVDTGIHVTPSLHSRLWLKHSG